MEPTYLNCFHCYCDFLASKSQIAIKKQNPEGRSYCSKICKAAASSYVPRSKRIPFEGVCPQCLKPFKSYTSKLYCSLKCYVSSADHKKHLNTIGRLGNYVQAMKITGEPPKVAVEVTCINCGNKRMVRGIRAHEKYCSQRCYRAYMAQRFDRWIANPQNIALPQCYDEFLMQTELPCLIDGCTWVGVNLGNHVNAAHGIAADEFKRAAGFNTKTGLVTPAISQMLADRPHLYDGTLGGKPFEERTIPPIVMNYRSLESREHQAKAIALRRELGETRTSICIQCGLEYQSGPFANMQKYCSVECRSNWYKVNEPKFWVPCNCCKKSFLGKGHQRIRSERGLPVYCSFHCRAKVNPIRSKTYRVEASKPH